MQLTRKQKRQIQKLASTKSAEKIADILRIPAEAVRNLLPKKFSNAKNINFTQKINEFEFRPWLKKNIPVFILFAVLIFICYINGINNEFLSDDLPTIANNAEIGTLKFVFSRPFVFLRGFLYFLIYNIAGKSQAAFRLSNIFFHIGVTYLFYYIISKLISEKIALFASLIFAVHPIISECVTWISGGFYPMYGFFLMLSFSFYISTKKTDKWHYLAILSYLLGAFTSERAIYFPGILFVYEICFGNLKQNWKKLLPFFLISGIWMVFFIYGFIGARVHELKTTYYQQKTSQNIFFQVPVAVSSYFELIFWPKNLTLYHSEMAFSKINFATRAIFTLSYFVFLVYSFIKNKKIFFWASFFLITLSPFLTPLGISWVVAERYVYLGSIAVFIFTAMVIEKIGTRLKNKAFPYIVLTILICALSTRTIVRNLDWRNQDYLWLAAGKTSPSSPQNHNNLGDLYARRKEYAKSIEEFNRAIALKPNYGDAYHNVANVYVLTGEIDKAIYNYQMAIKFNPNLWQSHQNLSAIYFNQGRFDLSEKEINLAVQINPQNSSLHTAKGIILSRAGKISEAKDALKIAAGLNPQDNQVKQLLLELENQPPK